MCFSAEASFISAALLGAAGFFLGCRFWGDRRFLVALTPLFFGIQQCAEGWVWVGLDHGASNLFAEYLYLFFAYLFWPLFVPTVACVAEIDPKRKNLLMPLLGMGAFLSVFNGVYLVMSYPIHPVVVQHSISYGPPATWLALLYGFVVIAPFFVSTIAHMKIVGTLVALFFSVALLAYTYAFTSLWCFAAALTTLLFLFTLKKEPRKN